MSWGLIFLSGLKCPSHADHFNWGKQLQRCSDFKETLWYWHDPCNDSSWTIPTFFLLQYSSYIWQNLILNIQSLVLFSTILFRLLIISFLPVISYLITIFGTCSRCHCIKSQGLDSKVTCTCCTYLCNLIHITD